MISCGSLIWVHIVCNMHQWVHMCNKTEQLCRLHWPIFCKLFQQGKNACVITRSPMISRCANCVAWELLQSKGHISISASYELCDTVKMALWTSSNMQAQKSSAARGIKFGPWVQLLLEGGLYSTLWNMLRTKKQTWRNFLDSPMISCAWQQGSVECKWASPQDFGIYILCLQTPPINALKFSLSPHLRHYFMCVRSRLWPYCMYVQACLILCCWSMQ